MSKYSAHKAYVRFTMLGEEREFCIHESAMRWVDDYHRPFYEFFIGMVERKAATADDLRRIIMTGLMGAGMPVGNALLLANRQLRERPLGEAWSLAVAVASAALFGNADYQAATDTAAAINGQRNA